ncbi:hypothetical protein [Streptomyces platensis]|uniref:hypothetical protein n=1 Tax=Streptomyces platensis TaxID=58346 RepID=UPI001F2CC5D9|nr:hypothetical protein [Streptomyces platensis]
MGMDITVLIVDWAHLMEIAPDARLEFLQESAYADDESDEADAGWVWPTEPDRSWLGRYEFGGTLGSYKPHFWAAQAWEDVRGTAGTTLRTALDDFLEALIWWGPRAGATPSTWTPTSSPPRTACGGPGRSSPAVPGPWPV